jgi:shikimate kinase
MDTVSARNTERGPGRLVVITGLPGSGKTTLATELARSMPAVRMCPDDWMMSSGIDLWRRVVERDSEGRWSSRSITRSELEEWCETYEPPTDGELATYDTPP